MVLEIESCWQSPMTAVSVKCLAAMAALNEMNELKIEAEAANGQNEGSVDRAGVIKTDVVVDVAGVMVVAAVDDGVAAESDSEILALLAAQ